MALGNLKIESYVPVVRQNEGIYTKYSLTVATGATVTLPSTTTIGGSAVSALGVITSTSANSLTVGRQGATAPAFNVDSSTASQAAGLNIVGATAAGTVAVAAISSGAAANLSVDALGTGTVTIAGTSTGNVTLGSTSNVINFAQTKIADGTTAIVTLGQYGGTGRPTAAGQSGWLKIKVAGTDTWLPVWI